MSLNCIFPKKLVHVFGQNFSFRVYFFWAKIDPEVIFWDVLDKKQTFLDIENIHFTESLNWILSKVHDFGQNFRFHEYYSRQN